jgi:RND superfamily putative drug exporter
MFNSLHHVISQPASGVARCRAVVLAWLLGLVGCAVVAAAGTGNIANSGVSVPGSQTARAEALASRYVPSLPGTLLIVVISSDSPHAGRYQQFLDIASTIRPVKRLADVRAIKPVESASYQGLAHRPEDVTVYFVSVGLPYAAAERRIPAIEAALAKAAGRYVSFGLLGEAATSYHYSVLIQRDIERAEFIALPITLCVLVIAFLSLVAALLPVLLAVVALAYTLAIVHLISLAFGLSVFVVNIATAIALGLSIDYALIIVTRFRQERESGLCPREATARAMQTAGRAVVLSGVTVAVLLPALAFVGVGLFASVALGGVIASLIAVAAAVTLLPAVLILLGERVERFSLGPAVEASRRGTFWRQLARIVTGHPWAAAALSLTALLVLSVPAYSLRFDFDVAAGLPQHSAAASEERNLADAFGAGATGFVEVVTSMPEYVRETLADERYEAALLSVVNGRAPWSEMYLILRTAPSSEASHGEVERLRERFSGNPPAALVGGATAAEIDLSDRIAERMPIVLAIAAVLGLLALAVGLKSIVIPCKALLCSVLSVGATLGLLQLIFASGGGEGIVFFVPIITFVLVLGLSIDYEVFLLSRIKELAMSGHPTTSAVSTGLVRTARPITLAGLVITTVFASFMFSSLEAVKQLGVAVTIGVLLDITLIRWILSPACVVLFGRWNWWFPDVRRLHWRRARRGAAGV